MILQAAQVDSGIRCAVVALGSLHEGFEKRGDSCTIPDEFALKQYNLAIRQHVDHLSNFGEDAQRTDSYVASCIVFMCIEVIQGHYISALSLVKGAVQLFYQCHDQLKRSSAWPLEVLESLLSRLQAQALGLVGPEVLGVMIPPRLKPAAQLRMPTRFKSISEAKEYLEIHSNTHALTKFSGISTESLHIQQSGFQMNAGLLSQWTSAFEALVDSEGDRMSDADQRATGVLKIWQIMMEAGIKMSFRNRTGDDDQILWDEHQSGFEQVVQIAERVVASNNVPANVGKTLHRFTLDFGIVGPLYDTARACRDPKIRRRAIDLLRMYPCREGLWDSLLAAGSAERQMELEEGAVHEVEVASDIPGWARITSVIPTFHFGERWASLVFTRQQQPWPAGSPQSFYEIVKW